MVIKTWNLEQKLIFSPLFFLGLVVLSKSSSIISCLEGHVEFRIDVCLPLCFIKYCRQPAKDSISVAY